MTEKIVKLIHPDTGVRRDVLQTNGNKISILKRAGFILLKNYRPPKVKEVVPDPTVAEVVEKEGVKVEVGGKKVAAEMAIHEDVILPDSIKDEVLVSKAAAEMIEELGLHFPVGAIEGTGKDGKITKPDVDNYLEELAALEGSLGEDPALEALEASAEAQEAEDEELDDNIEVQVILEDDGDLDSQEVEEDGSGEPEGD